MGKSKKIKEEIDSEQVLNHILEAKKLSQSVMQYSTYIDDLDIENEDKVAMSLVFEEYLDVLNKADETLIKLDKDNKNLNMKKLNERLENEKKIKKENVSVVEE